MYYRKYNNNRIIHPPKNITKILLLIKTKYNIMFFLRKINKMLEK